MANSTRHRRYGCLHSLYSKTRGRCHLCGEVVLPPEQFGDVQLWGRDSPTVDHLIPQSEGGDDSEDNLLLAHHGCNASRGTEHAQLARMRLSGRRRPPMSSREANLLSAGVGVGMAMVAGEVDATVDPVSGERNFNVGSALLTGGLVAGLTRLLLL